MSQTWAPWFDWLLRTALGGGTVLLAAWLVVRFTRQPVRQLRVGVIGVGSSLFLAALSIAPAWLVIPVCMDREIQTGLESPARPLSGVGGYQATRDRVPSPPGSDERIGNPPTVTAAVAPPGAVMTELPPFEPSPMQNFVDPVSEPAELARVNFSPAIPSPAEDSAANSPSSPSITWRSLVPGMVVVYLTILAIFLVRLLFALIATSWILRGATPATAALIRLFADVAYPRGVPRLLVSNRLQTPISCGLLRPTVVIPATLCSDSVPQGLRWALVHELAHLQRGDPWVRLLFGMGEVVFFFVPWFWLLRRQVLLCQEYVADDCATQHSPPEEYAQFLLSLSTAPALPAGALGVMGNSSDLFRRVTMLLKNRECFEKQCPRLWALTLGGGLLALAIVFSGVGLQARAALVTATEDEKKEEPAKLELKKVETPKTESKKPTDPAVPGFKVPVVADPFAPPALHDVPGGANPDDLMKQMRKQQGEMMRRMMKSMRGMPGPAGGLGGFANFDQSALPERARLGVAIDEPSATLISQLDLPKGQGVVIEEVMTDSPASKAGLKGHDILLELNGKPVPSEPEEFAKIVTDIKAKTPVDGVVLRKGKREIIKGITLPEVKEVALPGNFPGALVPPGIAIAPGVPVPPAFPIPPGGIIAGGAVGGGVQTSIFRNNDSFTTRHQEGSLIITVTGKVADGKAKVSEIKVHDGTESNKYETADKVPEQYRDKVKSLVEMSEKGSVKIEIKQP